MANKHNPANLVAGKYAIEDLVNLDALTRLFKQFSAATGFTVGFLAYPSQKVLIKTGWREACVKFHRACPATAGFCKASNVQLSRHLKRHREQSIRQCRMGLTDGATPIIVRGAYIAYLATGQIFFEQPDLDHYRKIARRFGFDPAKYLRAIQAVPVVSETRFRAALTYLSELATLIAEQGLLQLETKEQAAHLQTALTKSQQVEALLAESEQRFRSLIEGAPEAIFVQSHERFVYLNPAMLKLFGATQTTDLIGTPLMARMAPEFRRAIRNRIRNQCKSKRPSPLMEQQYLRLDGTRVPVETTAVFIRYQGRDAHMGFVRDITERKRLEQEIEHISELERQRLGRNLHDGVSQELVAIRYLAGALESKLVAQTSPAAADAARIVRELETATNHTHDLARGLFQVELKNGSILVALQQLASSTANLFKLNCRVNMARDIHFEDPEVARQLYRIAQEAMINAVKHSHGQNIWVRLVRRQGQIRLTVRDDGRGFSAKNHRDASMGLRIMQYRAGVLNAQLKITRPPGGGTLVTCAIAGAPSRPRPAHHP